MSQVDFGYVDTTGSTIYSACLQIYVAARNRSKQMEKSKEEWLELITKTEAVFEFLVEQGNKNGFNVDSILEIPDVSGQTCFSIASEFSKKICNYIIERPIQVNSISMNMSVPLTYPNLAIRMMKKGVNPHVINNHGFSRVEMILSSFERGAISEEAKLLLSQFSRSIHFSVEDVDCPADADCPADCPSKFKKFYYKNGALVEMTDENRIGTGGFGMVFKQEFHGIPMAMKCVWTDGITRRGGKTDDAVSDLNTNISEIRTQTSTVGPGVIAPVAFIRQQDQEQENEKWIANNYNIFIYPLYDCNLYELHEKYYDQFSEELLKDILNQCLTRKCSKPLQMSGI